MISLFKGSGFFGFLLILTTSCVPPASTERSYQAQYLRLQYLKRYAESFIGTPYKFGGSNRDGMDCSGLVVRVYADVMDKNVPHSTHKLYRTGRYVPRSQIYTGDLVFFGEGGYRVTHVGIFLGDNRFIHTSSTKGVVVSKLDIRYYKKRFLGARRILSPRR
ncbi:MAG: C40 family peptidase [bacterium]